MITLWKSIDEHNGYTVKESPLIEPGEDSHKKNSKSVRIDCRFLYRFLKNLNLK